ncbi:MAG: DUF5674 family protein [Elusimicrobiota bacterium]
MRGPEIFRQPIPRTATEELAAESFEDMVKFVVDLGRNVICAGGGLHADEEQLLLEDGSRQEDLWGANYYLTDVSCARYEFTSMINIRPSQANTAQLIQSEDVRRRVRDLAVHFFESSP